MDLRAHPEPEALDLHHLQLADLLSALLQLQKVEQPQKLQRASRLLPEPRHKEAKSRLGHHEHTRGLAGVKSYALPGADKGRLALAQEPESQDNRLVGGQQHKRAR